jgi:hypothetical protein
MSNIILLYTLKESEKIALRKQVCYILIMHMLEEEFSIHAEMFPYFLMTLLGFSSQLPFKFTFHKS